MLTQDLQRKIELALIGSIGWTRLQDCKPGRLATLYKRLGDLTIGQLEIDSPTSDEDVEISRRVLEEFGKRTGWKDNGKHAATMVLFCIDMNENESWDIPRKILSVMEDIIGYFERAGKMPVSSSWSGRLAAEKWTKLIKEENC